MLEWMGKTSVGLERCLETQELPGSPAFLRELDEPWVQCLWVRILKRCLGAGGALSHLQLRRKRQEWLLEQCLPHPHHV